MLKNQKLSDNLKAIGEQININMYDNGYMVEANGRDRKGDYRTMKIVCGSVDAVIELLKEAAEMERER